MDANPPRIRHACRLLASLSALLSLGCERDNRSSAVESVLAFAREAPFTIDTPGSKYAGYEVIAEDSALERLNQLFELMHSEDSTRVREYKALPIQILFTLPVTSIESLSHRPLGGDTLLVQATFRAPDRALYESALSRALSVDSTATMAEARVAFKRALTRARSELQERDTAFFWVRPGPSILKWRTARWRRDSVTADSLTRIARTHWIRLSRDAQFSRTEVTSYEGMPRYMGGGGGALEGWVDPGEVGWFQNDDFGVDTRVQCEARRGDSTAMADGWVNANEGAVRERKKFLCTWLGDAADEWARIRPNAFRVRLLLNSYSPDTVAGPWVTVER